LSKTCIDFKKFVEKVVDHRDAVYHKETTSAAKLFAKMETGQNFTLFFFFKRSQSSEDIET